MPMTFCAILTAYLLATFVLRKDRPSDRIRPILNPLLQAAVAAVVSCLLLGALHWPILLAILLTVFVIAAIRARQPSDSAAAFLVDQSARLAVLLALSCYFPNAAKDGWWAAGMRPGLSKWYFAALSCASGIVLCVPAGGVLISHLIRPLHNEICDQDITGLKQGGRYIGWLERILVLLLVLVDQPSGIGFLITAKSILRFGEIKDASQRKVAEYIIIGTFLSFGWALLISTLTRKAIQYWIP